MDGSGLGATERCGDPAAERAAELLGACAERFGADVALAEGPALEERRRCTFPWGARALGLVRPRTAAEAAEVVALAGRLGAKLRPVSRGRSWGLGSALPARDALILDLSRLDRILDLDPVHGTVRIEPGVTFDALSRALADSGCGYHVPAFGGPPDASVLANAIDRGEGGGALGDRFAHLWDLDVALSTGERVRTGHGRTGDEALSRVHARPAGPLIEGLFSQSRFGCVLSGRLALAPAPRFAAFLTGEIGGPEALGPVAEVVRALIREEALGPHEAFFWDGAKRVSSVAIRADLDAPPEGLRDWSLSVTLVAHHRLLFDGRLALAVSALTPVLRGLEAHDESDEAGGFLRGFSDGANVTSCYWAKPALGPAPLDPDRDRCGVLWLCPSLPLEGAALARLGAIADDVSRRFGVFAATGAEAATPRALIGYLSLVWDRDAPGADEAAMAAHDAAFDACAEAGFAPYRAALPTAARAPRAPAWDAVVARLACALDPSGALGGGEAPG